MQRRIVVIRGINFAAVPRGDVTGNKIAKVNGLSLTKEDLAAKYLLGISPEIW